MTALAPGRREPRMRPREAAGLVRRARVGDAAPLARADVQAWRETYPGIVPQRFLDRLDPAVRARYWRGALGAVRGPAESAVFVAEMPGHGIVGFGACGDERVGLPDTDGEFHALYLLKVAQDLGLGRRLMQAMARELVLRGARAVSVWTLRDNRRARAFYEKLGGRLQAERPLDFDGTPVWEVGYGWPDVRAMLGPAADEEAPR
jgi:ribosomal protein S18 acetylase RimI-like enzyme